MRIAITGGTGFVGRHLARRLVGSGHQVVLIARGRDRRDLGIRDQPGVRFVSASIDSPAELALAFLGCHAVAHLAGVNRELGRQTYARVHVEGTAAVVEAARRVGVHKVVLLSFLRARPNCGSAYHESKWAAEEIVRHCDRDWTVVKAGVIHGSGDHMLDHLSRALHTFPFFLLVGRDRPMAPLAVQDAVRVLESALVDGKMSRQTVSLVGPEQLRLSDAVARVGLVTGHAPRMLRLPARAHMALARVFERTMTIPLITRAQVQILDEGVTEASGDSVPVPAELAPTSGFSTDVIRQGLPAPARFHLRDLRFVRPDRGQPTLS